MTTESFTDAKGEKPAPTVRYLSGRTRETVIHLAEPVEVDGTTYSSFTVRRLTARDLEDYRRQTPEERAERPIINIDISRTVYDALDADDSERLGGASYDFLPQFLRGESEPTPPSPGGTPSNSDDGLAKGLSEASTGTGTTS